MEKPRVGVIICNYNYEDYVCSAIQSAVNQDYENLEVVVVDDASTDNSVSNIHDMLPLKEAKYWLDDNWNYFKKDKINNIDITIIGLKNNVKQGAARNIAIKECWDRCDYFQILDADDEMLPHKVSTLVARAIEFPDLIGGVYADYTNLNTEDNIALVEYKPPFNRHLLMNGDCHIHSGALISKKALEKVGLFFTDECPKEDYGLWLRIAQHFVFVHVPEVLTKVRVTPQNSTVIHTQQQHEQQYRKMWENFQKWMNNKQQTNS